MTETDRSQDDRIRQNADAIRRNEALIREQAEYLRDIRNHYFPSRSFWNRLWTNALKILGVVLAYAGLTETANWYWNTRVECTMAKQCAEVAERLLERENDPDGAVRFFEKAVELDRNETDYRIRLAYARGIAVIDDLFDLGRQFTVEESAKVEEIQAESIYLRTIAPDRPMPYVLTSMVQALRGDKEGALESVKKAVELAPEDAFIRLNSCGIHYAMGCIDEARRELARAEAMEPDAPFVCYWKGRFAMDQDKDLKTAKTCFEKMVQLSPGHDLARLMLTRVLFESGELKPAEVRPMIESALMIRPASEDAMLLMSRTYEREGDYRAALEWLDRHLKTDEKCMAALAAHARLSGLVGDRKTAMADLDRMIELAPFNSELRRLREKSSGERQK